MKISIVLLFLVSSSSFAGGSVVRNGGGLGEMTAVMIFQKMDRYLNSCLQNPKACDLTEPEATILKKVALDFPTEIKSYNLQFFSKLVGPDVVTEKFVGSPIALRSAALADGAGVPYPFSQIGGLVLSGLLLHQGVSSMDLAQKIFRSLKANDTTLFVHSETNIVHWIQVQTMGSPDAFDEVILEQSQKSFDLFPLIQSDVLLCPVPENLKLRIQNLYSANPMAKIVIFDVNWNCGGNSFGQAKIELALSFSDSGDFEVNNSQAKAFGVIKP